MSEATLAKNLGRYELVHLLGQGGMGEVYLAKISGAAGFEKPCIVKTILPAHLSDPQFLDRFRHEAKTLVHLVHSNIAQVYELAEVDQTTFMALEYVPGVDLGQIQSQARRRELMLPLPFVLFLGQKMAEGLAYAHRKTGPDGTALGIVHRDVSPQNVMVSYEGEVKVIDFGLAKSAVRSKHTLPSTVMGKLGYMSPEQARAEPVDHRSDIYSCGVVIWELLSGKQLIPPGTMGEMMAAMANPRPAPLHLIRPDVDESLDRVVRKALLPDRNQRYQRADELARALAEALIHSGSTAGAEEIGNFVRELCPEAYAEQRKLISKLTTLRPKTPAPSSGAHPKATFMARPPSQVEPVGIEATTLRSSSAPAAPAEPPLSQPLPAPRSGRLVLVALLLVVAVAAGAGAAVFVLTKNRPAQVTVVQAAAPAAPVAPTPPPAPAPTAAPAQPAPPSPVDSPPPGEAAEQPAAPEPPPESPAPRQVKKKSTSETELVTARSVAEVFIDRGSHYLRAGAKSGLAVGDTVQVVGPSAQGGKRKLLGNATVLEVWPALARVSLDDGAREAKGKRFGAISEPASAHLAAPSPPSVPSAPATTPPKEAAPASAPPAEAQKPTDAGAPRKLLGYVSKGGIWPLETLIITNADKGIWSDCFAILQGKKAFKLGSLAPRGRREIGLNEFSSNPTVRFVRPNTLGVTCAEGEGDFPVQL
ncbi:MAG: serine/threonine protein kinase [Myxococcales bacterium]|nr:serine/threonine protein kinase [Myxococcales bacterium]